MRELIVSETAFPLRAALMSVVPAAGFLPGAVTLIGIGFGIAAAMVASAFRVSEGPPP